MLLDLLKPIVEKQMKNLDCQNEEGVLRLVFPDRYYSADSLFMELGLLPEPCKHSIEILDGHLFRLEIRCFDHDVDLEQALMNVFSRLNGYTMPYVGVSRMFYGESFPEISCIIILTANDLFVARHLIPSILWATRNRRFEIIIVYNGLDCNLSMFEPFSVVESEFGSVSKAYNRGAHHAKGEVLAFFHDDCIMLDEEWVDKSLSLLAERETIAVTPEIKDDDLLLKTAKCVPLVIRKKDFNELNGFDENIYIGYEDLDFYYAILEKGLALKKLSIRYQHFSGMSTILMLNPDYPCLKKMFEMMLIPKRQIERLATYSFQNYIADEMFGLSLIYTIRYIIHKHRRYIEDKCGVNASFSSSLEKNLRKLKDAQTRFFDRNPELRLMDDQALWERAIVSYKTGILCHRKREV